MGDCRAFPFLMRNKLLELFAGVGSVGNPARALGWQVHSLDFDEKLPNIDTCCDIMDWDYKTLGFIPDVVWASPECKAWSVAAAALHSQLVNNPAGGGGGGVAVQLNSDYAHEARKQLNRTLEIIAYFLQLNPSLKWYLENPASSRMWSLPEMRVSKKVSYNDAGLIIPRLAVIDQCQYGREIKKPTAIATNDLKWQTRARCDGACPHKRNTGGSKPFSTKSYRKRASFPESIATDILSQLSPIVFS